MIETIISNFHLEKIGYIIRKKLAWMVILGAIGGMAGGTYASMTSSTVYRATTSFYVYSDPDYVYDSSINISNSDFNTAKNLVQSYTLILKSSTVLKKVIEETGLNYTISTLSGKIATSVVSNTAVFYVYVNDADPFNAMEIANAIGEIAPGEIARIVKSGGIEVIDYADLPTTPYSTTSVLKFVILGFGGLFAASMVIFLFFGLLDTTIRRRYELRLAFNIPILGDVPQINTKGKKAVSTVLSEESPFVLKESYNAIRTNMLFTGKGEKCPIYAVTSAEQGEGKTLNSINLAVGYAQLGKKVLLIDGDMRNSSIRRGLKLTTREGLSDYLAGLNDTLRKTEYIPNLDVVVGGTLPPNPAELMASNKMIKLLDEQKEMYDCIIIDMPPIGIVTDALLLAKQITGYILIVRAFMSKMVKEKSIVGMLEQVDADVCGIIFNGLSAKSQDYNYKYYKYDYKYGQNGRRKGKHTEDWNDDIETMELHTPGEDAATTTDDSRPAEDRGKSRKNRKKGRR